MALCFFPTTQANIYTALTRAASLYMLAPQSVLQGRGDDPSNTWSRDRVMVSCDTHKQQRRSLHTLLVHPPGLTTRPPESDHVWGLVMLTAYCVVGSVSVLCLHPSCLGHTCSCVCFCCNSLSWEDMYVSPAELHISGCRCDTCACRLHSSRQIERTAQDMCTCCTGLLCRAPGALFLVWCVT